MTKKIFWWGKKMTKKIEAKRKASNIIFVKMKNDKGIIANVHPDEIENYKKGNYVKV